MQVERDKLHCDFHRMYHFERVTAVHLDLEYDLRCQRLDQQVRLHEHEPSILHVPSRTLRVNFGSTQHSSRYRRFTTLRSDGNIHLLLEVPDPSLLDMLDDILRLQEGGVPVLLPANLVDSDLRQLHDGNGHPVGQRHQHLDRPVARLQRTLLRVLLHRLVVFACGDRETVRRRTVHADPQASQVRFFRGEVESDRRI